MTGHRPFSELKNDWSPERLARRDARMAAMALETLPFDGADARETTTLSAIDHEVFFTALNEPPEPTPALKDAFGRHGRTVVSR